MHNSATHNITPINTRRPQSSGSVSNRLSSTSSSSSSSSSSPSSCTVFRFSHLKSLVLVLLGFYLGGLHSYLYYNHHHYHHYQQQSSFSSSSSSSMQQLTPTKTITVQRKEQQRQSQRGRVGTADRDLHKNPVCRYISSQFDTPFIPHPQVIWGRYLSQVHAATQLHKNDPGYHYHDYTAQLLQMLTVRLPRSQVQSSHDRTKVDRVLRKAWDRYEYLRDRTSHETSAKIDRVNEAVPTPVKILFMGGSVLIGRNCRKLHKDMNIKQPLPVCILYTHVSQEGWIDPVMLCVCVCASDRGNLALLFPLAMTFSHSWQKPS